MILDFMRLSAPALIYIVFFSHFSSVGRRSEGGNGLSVRIPAFLHKILFPGAARDTSPLYAVIMTVSSLLCLTLTVVFSVLAVCGTNEPIKAAFRRSTFGVPAVLFVVSALLSGLAIALWDKRLPPLARALITAVILFAAFSIFKSFL